MDDKRKKFEALVRRYSKDLYRYGYWLAGDPNVAEDLSQETFLRAWRYWHTLQDYSVAKLWLIKILRRENARRFERKTLVYSEYNEDKAVSNIIEQDTRIEALVLTKALANMKLQYKEPLIMQVIFGMSCKEIAQELDISNESVMTRLFRARNKLKQQLQPEPNTANKPK